MNTGDVVVCITEHDSLERSIGGYLEIGKHYVIKSRDGLYVSLIGEDFAYLKSNFISLSEYREKQLSKLL